MSAARSPREALVAVLGSQLTACVLLFLLFILTFLGTLEQAQSGLYEVQKKYFESVFLVHRLGGVVPVPLPGAYLVLACLAVNLVVGGILRVRFTRAKAGVLLVHVGILILLASGLVKHELSTEGALTLHEGERSDEFRSHYEWELVIFDAARATGVKEWTIPDERLTARARTFASPELPFRLTVSGFERNARVVPASGPGAVDGFAIAPRPLEREAEMNVPALRVRLEADGTVREGIVSALARFPLTCAAGGRTWALDLRKRRFQLPFTIALDRFTRELHPRTAIARVFRSEVTKLERGVAHKLTISMNEPLRHGGFIIFQSGWGPEGAAPGTPLFSTFAVVENPSDQWPLVGCLVIAAGMLLAFAGRLFRAIAARPSAATATGAPLAKVAAASLLVLALASPAAAQSDAADAVARREPPAPRRAGPWRRETLALLASLPVQEGGRVKPLDTLAGFQLLRLSGRRSLTTPEGESLPAVAWLLDTLFFPETAAGYDVFLVEDSAVLDAIGVRHDAKRKRDRYNLRELSPGIPRLFELARAFAAVPANERAPLQEQVLRLAHGVSELEQLAHFLDFARAELPGGERGIAASLRRAPELLGRGAAPSETARAHLRALDEATAFAHGLAYIPPPGPRSRTAEWLSPRDVVERAFARERDLAPQIDLVAGLEALERAKLDADRFHAASAALHGQVVALARGESDKVPLEVFFYKADFFDRALVLFGLAFLLALASSLGPRAARARTPALVLAAVATALLVAGIAVRSVIRGRPPVSTLYETILFVTATATLLGLVVEWITRRRVALVLVTILGAAGLFMAHRYEFQESVTAGDTMPSLVAVLDTNFWLALHVTAITLGYGAALLASAVAHVWLGAALLGRLEGDPELSRSLTRTTYGVTCFALFFSLVGTILGGIWANYSWGRFWGWDPKENGALMICLWQAMVVHARLGGYVKEHGLAALTVLGGVVVAFSWWGVNLLGVGLHSYGFTSGVARALVAFSATEATFVAVSLVAKAARARRV